MSEHPAPCPEPLPAPDPEPLLQRHAPPLPRRTHVRETPTLQSMRLTTACRGEGVDLRSLEDRFPHVLNRVSAEWDPPRAALEVLEALLFDQRGGRQGFPDDAFAALLALHRCCVERIAKAVGL